ERVGAADPNHAADLLRRQALRLEVARVQREQGDEVPARRVPGNVEPLVVGAELLRVLRDPGERAGYVLDVLGMLHARRQPVVRDRRPDAARRKGAAEVTVDVLDAVLPGPSVDEEQQRERFL